MNHEHHTPVRTYLVVFAILVVLLVATIGVSFLPLGRFALVVALAIAFCKAVVVALYFMHLKFDNRLFRRLFVTGIVTALLVFSVVLVIMFARGGPAPSVTGG